MSFQHRCSGVRSGPMGVKAQQGSGIMFALSITASEDLFEDKSEEPLKDTPEDTAPVCVSMHCILNAKYIAER